MLQECNIDTGRDIINLKKVSRNGFEALDQVPTKITCLAISKGKTQGQAFANSNTIAKYSRSATLLAV